MRKSEVIESEIYACGSCGEAFYSDQLYDFERGGSFTEGDLTTEEWVACVACAKCKSNDLYLLQGEDMKDFLECDGVLPERTN